MMHSIIGYIRDDSILTLKGCIEGNGALEVSKVFRWHILTIVMITLCGAILASMTYSAAWGGLPWYWYNPVFASLGGFVAGCLGYFVAPWFGRPGWRGWATSAGVTLATEFAGAALVGMLTMAMTTYGILMQDLDAYRALEPMLLWQIVGFLGSAIFGGGFFGAGILFYSATNPFIIMASLGAVVLIHLVARLERRLASDA